MVIAVPIAVGIALFITHYAPRRLAAPVAYVIDLLAAVPSIIYGLWGALFLVPHLDGPQPLAEHVLRLDRACSTSRARTRRPLAVHRRHPAGDHDPADHHQRQPRGDPPGAEDARGGGARARRDPLGGHPALGAALRAAPASSPPRCWAWAARSARPWPSPPYVRSPTSDPLHMLDPGGGTFPQNIVASSTRPTNSGGTP